MNSETRNWFLYQLRGLLLIAVVSVGFAVGTNTFRTDSIPWVEKRRLLTAGDRLPYVPLPTSAISQYRSYLGLPPDKEIVTIVDIQADLLVIEILNVFCFPCQTQMLSMKNVSNMIEERPDLKDRIKIIGVALGNTKIILDDFIQTYGLTFPIIPDPEAHSEKVIGPGIHTPFSLFIRRDRSGKLGLVAGTHDGAIENPQIFFNGLLSLLEAEPETLDLDSLFQE